MRSRLAALRSLSACIPARGRHTPLPTVSPRYRTETAWPKHSLSSATRPRREFTL